MHSIEEILIEIEHLKGDVKESIQDFKDHTVKEEQQFLKLEKQHLDLIGIIGRLTTAIEVYSEKSAINIKWLRNACMVLFTGVGIALGYIFLKQTTLETEIKAHKKELLIRLDKIEKGLAHEIDKDVYYDKNRDVIYQMIEKYKLKRSKR